MGAAGFVPRGRAEVLAVQQRDGEQAAFEPGVLLGYPLVGAQGRGCAFDLLALEGVADGAAEGLGVEVALAEVVLGTGGDGGEPGLGLGEAGQHDDGGVGGGVHDAGDRVEAVHVREVQVEQDADQSVAPGEVALGLGEGADADQFGVEVAVGERLLQQERVAGVVLDEKQYGVDGSEGAAHRSGAVQWVHLSCRPRRRRHHLREQHGCAPPPHSPVTRACGATGRKHMRQGLGRTPPEGAGGGHIPPKAGGVHGALCSGSLAHTGARGPGTGPREHDPVKVITAGSAHGCRARARGGWRPGAGGGRADSAGCATSMSSVWDREIRIS